MECESPSDDAVALERFVSLMEDVVAPMAKIRTFRHGHMRAEFALPGAKKSGRILVLGHADTVWPMGTLRSRGNVLAVTAAIRRRDASPEPVSVTTLVDQAATGRLRRERRA